MKVLTIAILDLKCFFNSEIRSLHKFTNRSLDNDDILGMEDDLQNSNDDPDANKDDNCLLNRNNVLCSAQDFSK